MKLINPSWEIIEQKPGLEGIYEQIELAGRTCYRSTRKEGTTAKDFVDRMIASQHCYTGNSMVLTEDGWIPWNSYNGERVAVVNNSGDFIGFELPQRVVRHTYTGNFYYYPSLGIEVTEGHRMYGLFREGKNNFYNSTLYDTFICGQPYKDNNGRQKTLGERMFKTPKHCKVPIHTDPFYELVGFWLGDGCYHPQTINKLIFHLKKKRKIEYLQNLCDELGYTLEIGKGNYYRVCSPQIGEKFNHLFYHEGKYIPNMYKANDAVAVKSIILGLINSDGSMGTNTKTVTFTSTSYNIIQWINNVAAIGGFTASFRGVCHETPVHNPVYKILLLDTAYTINNDSRNPDSKVRITSKTENVYCVTVSTGLIIVRGDNGVTSICGNCAMLEHGAVYLKIPIYYQEEWDQNNKGKFNKVANSPYSKIIRDSSNNFWYLSTNLRVIKENNAEFLLEYWSEPTEFHEKRITIKFIADIHFYKDITRHRLFSWAIESTRFCNYMKKKFKMSVSFMKPTWIREEDIPELEEDCRTIESIYFKWINKGYQAQHAAYFLPQGTKAEVIMTGFQSDYKNFFDLRAKGTTGAPHPDVKALVEPVYKTFIERDYI